MVGPSPLRGWLERWWTTFIRASETAIVLGLVVGALTASDMIIVNGLFLAACVVSVLAIATQSGLSKSKKLGFCLVVIVVLGGLDGFAHLRQQMPLPPEAVFRAQVKELGGLEDFIGRKDEMELRDLFDFPNLLKFNIESIKRDIDPAKVTASESAAIKAFFESGQGVIDIRFIRTYIPPNGGAKSIFGNPGSVSGINLSKKYLDRKRKLFRFESSADLPLAVRDAAIDFDRTLDQEVNSFSTCSMKKFGKTATIWFMMTTQIPLTSLSRRTPIGTGLSSSGRKLIRSSIQFAPT
jgi:hypothetical protein